MPNKGDHMTCFQISSKYNWKSTLWSGIGAVIFTLLMFLTIPLLNIFSGKSSFSPSENLLDVMASRQKKTEANREIVKAPKPPEPFQLRPEKKPKPVYEKPKPLLALPIKVETNLPVSPGIVPLSALDTTIKTMGQALAGVYSEEQLDLPLMVLARMPPVYPIQARRRGTEGWVRVLLTVDKIGKVTETAILEAEPVGVFEKCVERCVLGWRFKPGTVNGTPVKARIETTIEFKLASG